MQNVEAIQRLFTDETGTEQSKSERPMRWLSCRYRRRLSNWAPGPSDPRAGVALAIFEPTVIAQIASWSQGK